MPFKQNSTIIINEWSGRLGNNLMQLSNGIFLCKKFNCQLDYPAHKYLKAEKIDYSDGSPTNYYVSRFYDKKECKGHYANIVERRKIFQEVINDLLVFNLSEKLENTSHDLVLQIRSGDIFGQKPPRKYVPSPMSFFEKIIEENHFKSIKIVCEDLNNPCIEALYKKYPFISIQSSDLESDLRTLVNAENLCITVGTFGYIVCLLSKKLKNLYIDDIPKGILDFGFFSEENRNLPFNIHRYKIRNYIPFMHWNNSESQLKLVMNHSKEDVIYDI